MKLGFLVERLNFEKISVPLITRLKVKSFFVQLKFSFSEKATRIFAIFLMVLISTIAQVFVSFSEKLTFTTKSSTLSALISLATLAD